MKPIFFLFCVVLLSSCQNNEIIIDKDNLLIGTWTEPVYNDEITTYKRSNALPKEAYGISFNSSGDFKERTSGFCGTPPLTFFNVDGNFQLENTLISISTQSYPSNYALRIILLTEEELVVKRELTEQEKDYRSLMDLFSDIQRLSNSISCTDSENWLFTGFGAKACGGYQGYIAYSKDLDTDSFLQKVDNYSKAEKAFNKKWNIVSDCAIINPPISVECKNGYAILNY
mgnify:CR=1 FL=1